MSWASRARAASRFFTRTRPRPGASRTRPARSCLRGDLPEGEAIAAFNHDPGVPRVPTFCRFELHAALSAGAKYRLVLPEGEPLPLALKDGKAMVTLG